MARGPFNSDVYLPPLLLPFSPDRGATLDSTMVSAYRYFSFCDAAGVERRLTAYFIGPDGRGYEITQSVGYGPGDPLDPSTERIPDSLETAVFDLGVITGADLLALLRNRYPHLSIGQASHLSCADA